MYKEFRELRIFGEIEKLADEIWTVVTTWNSLAKYGIGSHLTEAIDSVTANMEEADGRYHYREKINFLYIGRGSLKEARNWLTKIQRRGLLPAEQSENFLQRIDNILPQYNAFISDFKKRVGKSSS